MTHSKSGELIDLWGHNLTVREGHSALFGLIGLFVGAPGEISDSVREEPQYAFGVFMLSYVAARLYFRYID